MNADALRIVDHVNATHGFQYQVMERFSAGEQGAYALEDADGARAVLKWIPHPQAVRHYEAIRGTTERLLAAGYPLPRFLAIGVSESVSYAVQERVHGAMVERISVDQIVRLIALNHMQMNRAAQDNPDWQADIIRSVLEGWSDYCVIESLRTHSDETRHLLDRAQQVVAAWEGIPCPSGDIVHFDFHHRNILFDGDDVSGVVDWDGCQAGDCLFDLVTLLFYMYDDAPIRGVLRNELYERGQRATIAAYIAHMAVRQIDWMIRFYDEMSVATFVSVSNRMLDGCVDDPPSSASRTIQI